jgi:hypothetical protein
MPTERQQIEATIAALEAQRAVLGDAVVAMAIAPLRDKLTALRARAQGEQQLKTVTISSWTWSVRPSSASTSIPKTCMR